MRSIAIDSDRTSVDPNLASDEYLLFSVDDSGPVTVQCRSFDSIYCSKGDEGSHVRHWFKHTGERD